MRLAESTIHDAFRKHHEIYATGRGWGIDDHVRCWSRAWRAFEHGSAADFEWLYDELRRRWQVFRAPKAGAWTPAETLARIAHLDQRIRSLRLATLCDDDLCGCWRALDGMKDIKATKAPSVVAISKFLHFWNPRLFVIVDDWVMWQRVLSRSWLKRAIDQERSRLQVLLPDAVCIKPEVSCDLLSYLAVLSWSAMVICRNPAITPQFAAYLHEESSEGPFDFPADTYDGAAMEWLLLGLAEIPPHGVVLD